MFKKLIFLFFPLTVFGQYSDTLNKDYKAFFYENGNISSEGILENGEPNRYWITYYKNGLRKSEGNRDDFKLNGKWKFYAPNGNIKNSIAYINGVKEGKTIEYDTNCYKLKEENYINDTLNGEQIIYHPDSTNSIIKESYIYLNGRKEGLSLKYDKEGNIITLANYIKGTLATIEKINRYDNKKRKKGIWKEFYKNYRLKKEETYKNGLLNGYVKNYKADGKLESAVLYIDGKKQEDSENIADFDLRTSYFSDGKVKANVIYNLAGKKDGISTFYKKNGEVEKTEFYRNDNLLSSGIIDINGKKQGKWENYYLNGNIKSKGNYKAGKKVGKWIYYFLNGEIEQEGNYDNAGRYTGKWIWYYNDGSVLRREEYLKGLEEGISEEFTIDGKIISTGEYIEGEKEGNWIYELNDHKEKGDFRYGLKNGFWKAHHSSGKLSFEGEFIDGIENGKHQYFNTEGRLIKEENYNLGKKDGKWKWFDNMGVEYYNVEYKNNKERKINGEKIKDLKR